MKLLIHAINGFGLGHVIRTSRIAAALQKSRPDIRIVFVTNSKYSAILKKNYKTYTLKKDTRAVIEGQYSYKDYLQFNGMAIRKIILHERPDEVLFDCELNRELLLFCRENRIKTVFVLRIPTAERFSQIKSDLILFDAVIVPHVEKDFLLDQRKFLLKLNAVFTGPIVDLQQYPRSHSRKNILITLGSGAGTPQNRPLFSAVDSFLRFLRDNDCMIDQYQLTVDIVTGPYYEGGCDLSGFPVRSTSDSLVRDMYRAIIVISGAGYNTINEIIKTKTPAVVIPLSRPGEDQFQRADVLEQLGCIKVAHEGILEPVREILSDWKSYHKKFPRIKSGNLRAARILSGVLGGKKSEKS